MKITSLDTAQNVIPTPTHKKSSEPTYTTRGDELGLAILKDKSQKYFSLYREKPILVPVQLPGLWFPGSSPVTYMEVDPRTFYDLNPGVDTDNDRYEKILRGRARKELLKFKNPREMIGRKGGDIVSIPVPDIELPSYIPGTRGNKGGIGQGDGDIGTPITGPSRPGQGEGAGSDPAEHIREQWVRLSRFEIAQTLMEELGLPNLEPKGNENIKERKLKWNTYSKVGNEVNLSESVRNVLLRNIALYGKDFDPSKVIVRDDDLVFDSWRITEKPEASAVIIYMMDVSGSMSDDQKEWVRTVAWYLSTIIRYQFGKARADLRSERFTADDYGIGVGEVFITHDAEAREVDEETFFNTRESGGTKISSAYILADKIIEKRYDPRNWNIYLFHFSDGDNWGDDNEVAFSTVDKFMKFANHFGYIQTESSHGSGEFYRTFADKYGTSHQRVRLAKIEKGEGEEFRNAVVKMLEERDKKKK